MTDLPTAAVLALAGSAIVAALATPAVAALAIRFGGVDRPGERKMHVGAVPRMGGLAVFLGLIFGCSVFASVTGWTRLESVLAGDPFLLLLAPCGFVFLVGVVDDVRGLGPAPRVVGELLAAGVLIQSGFVLDRVATPFGGSVELGVLAVPLTLLWFVGVTNAYNLVDGLDGLMSALAIPALGGCAALAFAAGDDGTGIFALSLCGAVAGFLRWNWHPARIFLGDSGSLLVGFTVAAISLKVARGPGGAVGLHIPLALSAVPITETFLTLARRYVTGRAFFHGDLSHIHHVLVKSGHTVPGAVARMGLAAAAFAVVATLSRTWHDVETLLAIVALLAGIAFALSRLRYVEVRVLLDRVRDNLLRPRRKGLADLAAVARAGDCVRGADSLADLRDRLRAAVVEGRFSYLSLELANPAARLLGAEPHIVESRNPEADAYLASRNGSPKWLFSTESPAPPGDAARFQTFTLALPLPPGDGRLGRLVCSRYLGADVPAPPSQDMVRYLSAPVAEVLTALEEKARAAGYADGTGEFAVPYGILRTRRAMLSGEYAEPSKQDLGAAPGSFPVGL
jgi:UDP-GlcNAc:undecaprenyl-phosphate/decaprenyl-phosphate GlcNAc-1-phosphate transferase